MPARIPMTERQRAALLALPDTEAMVVRYHGLGTEDLAAIGIARTPATRLSYALQLCCLRYPGRHLRAGELLPAIMLDHIADPLRPACRHQGTLRFYRSEPVGSDIDDGVAGNRSHAHR